MLQKALVCNILQEKLIQAHSQKKYNIEFYGAFSRKWNFSGICLMSFDVPVKIPLQRKVEFRRDIKETSNEFQKNWNSCTSCFSNSSGKFSSATPIT